MTGTARPTVLLIADQQAIADAVSAALDAAGFSVVHDAAAPAGTADGGRVGLLLHALEPDDSVALAREVVSGSDLPWMVVASTPRGPGWEALLEAGASLVVDAAETSIDGVVQLLDGLTARVDDVVPDAHPAGAED
ncbi:hypothetical protein [Nocardioides mangrovi]|uniref:Response regulatory domain-containing protein n=1 Tax=Nocardioides mangrovi TaxID=2874580 RepID=A0ABS7UFZ1_9ACTN|nr:hypothetical protein [Nocardioides mangrovi]MBZ5739715.1 hypothetical protein [Nocardioides mangrovi]